MLKQGMQAPEFDLRDQDGRRHTLKSLLADGPIILYFYPADFTPGCTKEACSFRDLQKDLFAPYSKARDLADNQLNGLKLYALVVHQPYPCQLYLVLIWLLLLHFLC